MRFSLSPIFLAALVVAVFALPAQASAATVNGSLQNLQRSGAITATKATAARKTYSDARSLRKRLSGTRRTAMTMQIRTVESMARQNRITGDRVTPLFETLQNNTDWFRTNGPAAAGTDRRFTRTGRIIFQYFAGRGWEFHPLSNFAKLNAVWTDKSAAARRSLGKYAHELIAWGVNRGGALTWEYYFAFSGSKAPFISSISQGTAVQALARAGKAVEDTRLFDAGKQAVKAFDVAAPIGLKISRDYGYHYLGYSGNRRALILNMFLQSLDGLHDYAVITGGEESAQPGDGSAWSLYREGLKAARRETVLSDTGAWSLYSLGGPESDLSYHNLVIGFLAKLCDETKEDVFCGARANFQNYKTQNPTVTGIKKSVKRGRIYLSFNLSKISTIRLQAKNGGTTVATVGRGKRKFSVSMNRSRSVTLTATDLAGNRTSFSR